MLEIIIHKQLHSRKPNWYKYKLVPVYLFSKGMCVRIVYKVSKIDVDKAWNFFCPFGEFFKRKLIVTFFDFYN